MKLQYFCLFSFVNYVEKKNPIAMGSILPTILVGSGCSGEWCCPWGLCFTCFDIPMKLMITILFSGNSFNTIRQNFVYLKENLVTHTTLIDQLFALSVLSYEEKADFKDLDNTKCGKLLKIILRKGEGACTQLCTTIHESPEYMSLQNRQRMIGKSWTYPLCANWHIRP